MSSRVLTHPFRVSLASENILVSSKVARRG
jgi:hypothetical protein